MVRSFKRLRAALATFLLAAALILFLLFPARYAASVSDGAALWAVSVLPATLPLLFLTALFTERRLFRSFAAALSPVAEKVFRVSGAGGCCALLSALSGYPVGARAVLDLYRRGSLGEEELLRVAALSTTTGPAFLVGAVGAGMLRAPALGWLLYLSHLAGVYAVCFLLRFGKAAVRRPPPAAAHTPLPEAISSSVLSVLFVGGAIALFSAFGQMLADACAFLHVPAALADVLRGLLEMTTGCALFAEHVSAGSLALSCLFVTFGGVCVLVQQIAFLKDTPIKIASFLLVKLAQGCVAAAVCFALASAIL